MLEFALPVLAALALWWSATALALRLDRLPRATFRWTLAAASLLALAALAALVHLRDDTSARGAYLAFVGALVIWAWQELGFLTGTVTGPRRLPCRPGSRGIARARQALAAILYHELGVLAAAALIAVATWGGANQTALATFALLWVMRQSAKLNLFLGVPNTNEELLPPHLRYIATYFRRQPMNALFPFSVTVPILGVVWLVQQALAAEATPGSTTAHLLLAALLALGVLEHWLLVLPLPADALWRVALRERPLPPGAVEAAPSVAKPLR
ncbi:MAG: putative photosynthetic complex assembly protein PuhE [Burkholderiaceae bacterium]|nr:putative photosynthetic complex assembly protein PuhE [Burkholderiaceae bacterium]